MKTSFVYILKCSDDTYYVGVTSNLEKRLIEHKTGKYPNSYTAKRRPLEIVYFCEFRDIRNAIAYEKKIKKWSKAKKEALINEEYEKLPDLAKKKFK